MTLHAEESGRRLDEYLCRIGDILGNKRQRASFALYAGACSATGIAKARSRLLRERVPIQTE